MAETDALRISCDALILLGEAPISAFDQGGTAALVAAARYRPVAELMLSQHPWNWNRRLERLARLPGSPPVATGFDAAFAMPENCFLLEALHRDGHAVTEWELGTGQVWLDADAGQVVEARFHGWVDEALWPPLFVQALTYRLASDWALPITQNQSGAQDSYWKLSERELQKARHSNGFSRPAQQFRPADRLTRMHRR